MLNCQRADRGPVNLYASKDSELWYIQIKASSRAPRIKSREIDKLIDFASADDANPVIATLQPLLDRDNNRTLFVSKTQEKNQKYDICEADTFQRFVLFFYQLPCWSRILP